MKRHMQLPAAGDAPGGEQQALDRAGHLAAGDRPVVILCAVPQADADGVGAAVDNSMVSGVVFTSTPALPSPVLPGSDGIGHRAVCRHVGHEPDVHRLDGAVLMACDIAELARDRRLPHRHAGRRDAFQCAGGKGERLMHQLVRPGDADVVGEGDVFRQ